MRPKVKRAGGFAGTLCLTMTCAATLPAAAHADTEAAGTPFLRADDQVTAGARAIARGKAPGHAGREIALFHRAGSRGPWTRLAVSEVRRADRFRFRVSVPRSGFLRASVVASPDAATAATTTDATSNEQRISVARAVRVGPRRLHVRSGRRAAVAGRVLPGGRGVPVALQVRRNGRWATLDRSRTRSGGRYRLRSVARSTGRARLRVVARRADGLARNERRAGRLYVYRVAYASWYGPGLYGNPVACGGAPLRPGQLGVAHKSLPCGTRVTFRRGGRSVTVPVIDRGPYVGGREYDLTEATARRLGFHGHGAILATR